MSPATTNLTILELKYKLQRCEILCHIDFSDHTEIQFNQIRPLVAAWMTNFIKKNFAVQIPFFSKIKRKKKKTIHKPSGNQFIRENEQLNQITIQKELKTKQSRKMIEDHHKPYPGLFSVVASKFIWNLSNDSHAVRTIS